MRGGSAARRCRVRPLRPRQMRTYVRARARGLEVIGSPGSSPGGRDAAESARIGGIMATTRRSAAKSANGTNGRGSLDPVTHAAGRPAGPGMYLHWEGRKGYRTRMPAPRMLEPLPKLSFGKPRDNRVIEGDNLQVMVSLRSQYDTLRQICFRSPPAFISPTSPDRAMPSPLFRH